MSGFRPGTPAAAVDAEHTHSQGVAAAVWTITHPLGKRPSVTVVDSAGSVVYGDVDYVSDSEIEVTFSAAFAGKAYLN